MTRCIRPIAEKSDATNFPVLESSIPNPSKRPKCEAFAATTAVKKSTDANAILWSTPWGYWSPSSFMLPTSPIAKGLRTCWAERSNGARLCNWFGLTWGTKEASGIRPLIPSIGCWAWSNAPKMPKVSSSCLDAGWSKGPSDGSDAPGVWPRTMKAEPTSAKPSFMWPWFSWCSDDWPSWKIQPNYGSIGLNHFSNRV